MIKTLTFGLGKVYGFNKSSNELIVLEDEQKQKFYKRLWQSFRDFAKLCNYTSSLNYATKVLKMDKTELSKLGYNTSYGPILEKLSPELEYLNGNVLNQAYGVCNAHFKGEHGKRLMGKGETSLPSHKANGTHPLYFHKDAIHLREIDGQIYVVYEIFAVKWSKQNEMHSSYAFKVHVKPRDKTGNSQLKKIISGEWKSKSGKIRRNPKQNRKTFDMQVSVDFVPDPYKKLTQDIVMGIDLGVNRPATIHFRKNGKAENWALPVGKWKEMLDSRKLIKGEIKTVIRSLRSKDAPVDEKYREILKIKLRELRRREKRFIKTASQKVASQIAENAKRQGAKIWQMEDLSDGIRKDSWIARNWAPQTLIEALKWQAAKCGAEIVFVNPAYTSQRCSKCGNIESANRPKDHRGASYFCCISCGHEENADKNAARNLSITNIGELIAAEKSVSLSEVLV